tara:strand:- start:471 stop:656 length:186 start_codon:yes stop_codon:yes gene_type:complete
MESIKLLRDKAEENIKKFCKENNEDYSKVKNWLVNQADKYNTLQPIDFYINLYNESTKLLQ